MKALSCHSSSARPVCTCGEVACKAWLASRRVRVGRGPTCRPLPRQLQHRQVLPPLAHHVAKLNASHLPPALACPPCPAFSAQYLCVVPTRRAAGNNNQWPTWCLCHCCGWWRERQHNSRTFGTRTVNGQQVAAPSPKAELASADAEFDLLMAMAAACGHPMFVMGKSDTNLGGVFMAFHTFPPSQVRCVGPCGHVGSPGAAAVAVSARWNSAGWTVCSCVCGGGGGGRLGEC